MTEKVMLTSLVFMVVFIGAIRFHGDDKPSELVMGIIIGGLFLSMAMFIAGVLALIWA